MEALKLKLNSVESDDQKTMDITLSTHVKHAVELYFAQLNGHSAANLYAMVLSEVEKPLLETTLQQTGFNQTKAAKALGLSRSTLRKKLEQYNIS